MARNTHKDVEREHNQTVDELVRRLLPKGYDSIHQQINYANRGLNGEYDVLTTRWVDGVKYFHYYEVKAHYNAHSYLHARDQFKRAKKAYPTKNWRFIYITPTFIKRMRDLE